MARRAAANGAAGPAAIARARRVAATAVDRALGPLAGPLLRNHGRLARRAGLDRVALLLSFDCDTDADIHVAAEVHDRLAAAGVRASWAVPGELLERGAEVYRSIGEAGSELLSHGYRQHTELDPSGDYRSTWSYRDLAEVDEDIRRGHAAHLDVLGVAPTGFRVPHFGEFQGRRQLRFLYGVLRSLGYEYSSSTMPSKWLLRGPAYDVGGLVELPVSGRRTMPRRILDTWSFRFAPHRGVEADDYLAEVRGLHGFYADAGLPALLNLYADPSQVADWPAWFDLMADLAPASVPSFRSLIGELR